MTTPMLHVQMADQIVPEFAGALFDEWELLESFSATSGRSSFPDRASQRLHRNSVQNSCFLHRGRSPSWHPRRQWCLCSDLVLGLSGMPVQWYRGSTAKSLLSKSRLHASSLQPRLMNIGRGSTSTSTTLPMTCRRHHHRNLVRKLAPASAKRQVRLVRS